MEFTRSRVTRIFGRALGAAALCGLSAACQSTASTDSAASVAATSTITVSPGSEAVAYGAVIQFSASGGTGTYTYSIVGASETSYSNAITSSGVFTAPSTAVTLMVGAEDSNLNWGYSTITVNSTGTSTSSNSLTVSALAFNSVQVNCDSTQETYSTGSGICGDGTQANSLQSGNGMLATCTNSATVALAANISCGNSFAAGQSYTRSIWANSVLGLQLFCAPGETATLQTSICGSSTYSATAVTSSSGQQGFYANCPSMEAVGIGMTCSGTAP